MNIDHNSLTPLRRLRLIQSCNLLVAFLAAVAVVFKLRTIGLHNLPLPTLVVSTVALANFVLLRLSNNLDRGAWVLNTLFILGLILAAGANSGGFGGPVLSVAPIAPVTATLMINARAGLYSCLLTTLVLLVLLVLQRRGELPANPNSESMLVLARFLSVVLTTAICTAVVWGFATLSNQLIDEKQLQANTDHLTGLNNRRAFEAALLAEFARARRADSWLSLLMIDVDHFKRFNDCNGHQAGDHCLIEIGKQIASCSGRSSDIVGRFGGEEFIVLLADTDSEGARVVAERIRRSVLEKKLFYHEQGDDIVSVTIGVASARGSDSVQAEDLIKASDAALYQGKATGRNKVTLASLDSALTPPAYTLAKT